MTTPSLMYYYQAFWKEKKGLGLKSCEVADAVAYAISTPETVVVSDILIRPTKQFR